jgi:hypothetical protein
MPANSENQHFIETYKSLITLSIEGFKFCALANGGAAVAILSFLGSVSSKGNAVPDMRLSMGAFLAGLVACGLAMLFAYLTQLRLLNESANRTTGRFTHIWPLYASMFFVALSLIFFAFGSWRAVVSFH